jgi:hypothetical protein
VAKFFNYFTKNPIDHVAILPSKNNNDESIKILEATLEYGVIRSLLAEKLLSSTDVKVHLQIFNYPLDLQKYFEFRTKVIDKGYSKLEALVSGIGFFDIFFNTKKINIIIAIFVLSWLQNFYFPKGLVKLNV